MDCMHSNEGFEKNIGNRGDALAYPGKKQFEQRKPFAKARKDRSKKLSRQSLDEIKSNRTKPGYAPSGRMEPLDTRLIKCGGENLEKPWGQGEARQDGGETARTMIRPETASKSDRNCRHFWGAKFAKIPNCRQR